MKEKYNRVMDELAIMVNFAIYAAVCGLTFQFGKSLCDRIFR